MVGVSLLWWQTGWPEWSIEYLWNCLGGISRLDILVLGLALAYVVLVVSCASYRYRQVSEPASAPPQAPPEEVETVSRSLAHAHRALKADLTRGVRTLRAIASAAPFVGLAGMCFGILDAFRGESMQAAAAMALAVTYIAASLLATASGVFVALSAAAAYNYLLWLRDKLELRSSSGPLISSRFPRTRQFSTLPAFALVAAPALGIVVAAFMTFSSYQRPRGLPVRLLREPKVDGSHDPLAQPIFIALSRINAGLEPNVHVNSKETTWADLDSSLRNRLQFRPQTTVYVEADNDVSWTYITTVIDIARAHSDDVVLLTIASEFDAGHLRAPRRRPHS